MTPGIAVRDIMDRGAVLLTPETPMRRAVALLVAQDAAAGVVLREDGTLLGLLSQKDCFRSALHASYHQEWRGTVADHMTADPVTIDAGETVVAAAEMFLEYPHRVFPVLEKTRPVGMLHRAAVLAALSRTG